MDENVLNSVLLAFDQVACVGDWLSEYLQVSAASTLFLEFCADLDRE